MRTAILTTDNRQNNKDYSKTVPEFGTAPEALLQGFALLPEAEVHVVSCTQRPMQSPDKLADNIWFHSLHVPKSGWLRTGYQGCIRAVRRKLREIQPDIVHGQGTERDCAISAIFSGFPNVVTIHGNMAELARLFRPRIGSYAWLAARLENFTLRRTGGVFCNSAYTEGMVRPRVRRVWMVANPIRQVFFEALAAERKAGSSCVLLNVGVISPRKRQLELLGVAEALHKLGLGCAFEFIGYANREDNYVAKFLERIKPLEATGCARYVGQMQGQELMRRFDKAAGIVHFPSEEAFGLVVVEALSRDLKFFGANLGGIMDIASDVNGAELVEKEDWDGLTNAIARWVQQGHPCMEKAHQLMRERYHPEVIARRHLEIYREVLSTNS